MKKIIFMILLSSLVSLFANDTKQKIIFIEKELKDNQTSSQIWQYGWASFFTGIIAYDISNFSSNDKDLKYKSKVDFGITSLGLIDMIINPLKAIYNFDYMKNINTSDNEKLLYLENILTQNANQEMELKSYKKHLITLGMATLGGGLVSSKVGSKDGLYIGLAMFIAGELKIFTTPRHHINSLKRYQDFNNQLAIKKYQRNFFIAITPNYIGFEYKF